MKYLVEELVNDKAKRESYRNELRTITERKLAEHEASNEKYFKDIPNSTEGRKLWLFNLEFEHEARVLTILSECEESELQVELEKEEKRMTDLHGIKALNGFTPGFREGYLWHKRQLSRMLEDLWGQDEVIQRYLKERQEDRLWANLPEKERVDLEWRRREINLRRWQDEEAGKTVKTDEQYAALIEAENAELAVDIKRRKEREEKLGVTHPAELKENWTFTDEQLDKIEASIAEGKTVEQAQQLLEEIE